MLPRIVPIELDPVVAFQVVDDGKLAVLGTHDGQAGLDFA
jgi:hypothetical protein